MIDLLSENLNKETQKGTGGVRLSLCKMFLHEKTVEIVIKVLEAEKNNRSVTLSQLAMAVSSPYSYVSKIVKQLEEYSLLETKLEGRVRFIKLTEFGSRIAEMLSQLFTELCKDIKSLNRLRILEKVVDEGKDFRSVAGALVELESLKSCENEEVRREAVRILQKALRMVA